MDLVLDIKSVISDINLVTEINCQAVGQMILLRRSLLAADPLIVTSERVKR